MDREKAEKQKIERKIEREKKGKSGYQEISDSWLNRAVGMLGMVGILVLVVVGGERFVLSVEAAPATLRSTDATIYEETNEGSNAIGNLVEGGSFEYIGEVTAEDGSVWYQITTSNGTTGYIRGDREMEIEEEGPAAPEEGGEEPTPEEEPASEEEGVAPGEGNAPEEPNPSEEGGRGTGPEEREPEGDSEEGTQEDGAEEEMEGENLEGEDEQGEDGLISEISRGENRRAKSYALHNAGRIKGKEDVVPAMNMKIENELGKTRKKIDITLLLSMVLLVGCGSVMYVCISKIKRFGTEEDERRAVSGNAYKLRKRNEKRRHNQKRKNKKK